MAREPVAVNRAIGGFLDRLEPRPVRRRFTVPARREKRVLYLSSPIGLGHGRRDLAIAEELRRAACPALQVDWLAQPPLTDWLAAARRAGAPRLGVAGQRGRAHRRRGRRARPARVPGDPRDGRDPGRELHALRRDRRHEHYDLWVGDEAWELDHFLHENPELKTTAYAWITDFVGWLPMAEGPGGRRSPPTTTPRCSSTSPGCRACATARCSWATRTTSSRRRSVRACPTIRDWTTAHYDFAGYVTGFDPAEIADRAALRAEFGLRRRAGVRRRRRRQRGGRAPAAPGGRGGSAAARARARACGWSSSPGRGSTRRPCRAAPGVEVRGWLPDLHRLLAAGDVALVQGGLTTTMELTAAGRPFVYVPLRNHFEQNWHVRHRLEQYRRRRLRAVGGGDAGAAGRRAGRAGRDRRPTSARSSPTAPPAPRPSSPTSSEL